MTEVQSFLSDIATVLGYLITNLTTVTTALINNSIFKIIFAMSILTFALSFLFSLIGRINANKKGE